MVEADPALAHCIFGPCELLVLNLADRLDSELVHVVNYPFEVFVYDLLKDFLAAHLVHSVLLMEQSRPRDRGTRRQVYVVEYCIEVVFLRRLCFFHDLILHGEYDLVDEGVVQNEEIEKALRISLEVTILLVAERTPIQIEELCPMCITFRRTVFFKSPLHQLLMLPHAVIDVLLELNSNQFEVVVLLSAVLEISNQSHEEGLVEGPIGLVLLDVECCLWVSEVLRLAVGVVGRRLVSLLEHDDWLELAVQGPEHLLQAIYHFVVNEILQLAEHLDSTFALCELVEGGRHVLQFGCGCFLLLLATVNAWVHYVGCDYADFLVDFVEEAPLLLDLLSGHFATEET